ncbi:hypothetical protein [Croceimicrobium sp.]|uniref:hypothetical protein n=1 Tax=Croceimicrobium sp. TaxID=2828340 RepID=UPI003BAB2FF5
MTRSTILISLVVGFLFFGLGFIRPAKYYSEIAVFVPLTLLEKQIEQNGIGFGAPAEIDAHIELMRSPRIKSELKSLYPNSDFKFEVSKTRNNAVLVEVWASEPESAAKIAQEVVDLTDSLKQIMLVQNVGQSHAFVSEGLKETRRDMDSLQIILDSLRIAAIEDSIALASEVFKYEHLFGSEVVALNQLKIRRQQLDAYLKAPAPKSYIIYAPEVPDEPAGIPAWAMGLIAAALCFLAGYAWQIYRKQVA